MVSIARLLGLRPARAAEEITSDPGYQAHSDKVDAIAATAATRAIPTWKGHRCGARHRTYSDMAKCMFPQATIGIFGKGPYATLSCLKYEPELSMYGRYSVHLHKTEEEARASAGGIDDTGCGSGCNRGNWKGHRIIRLEMPGRK